MLTPGGARSEARGVGVREILEKILVLSYYKVTLLFKKVLYLLI